jgi:hypothetical protein
MSATTTWIIEWMSCKPTEGTLTDVVVTAGWRCNGTQTNDLGVTPVTYNATIYSTCSFPQPEEGGQFTPFAQLTEAQVLGWCYANGLDQTATETAIQSQIDNQINPPIIQPALPWSAA